MDETFSLLFAIECLALARLFYVRRQYPDAAHMLETLRVRCQKRGLKELVLQIDILNSAVFLALDRKKAGKSLLQKALLFSETEGYIRPFANDADLIAPLLKSIAHEQPDAFSTAHLGKVFSACNIPLNAMTTSHKIDNYMREDLTWGDENSPKISQ